MRGHLGHVEHVGYVGPVGTQDTWARWARHLADSKKISIYISVVQKECVIFVENASKKKAKGSASPNRHPGSHIFLSLKLWRN